MKYNLYDFDKTIYDGDSSKDFILFCFKKNKYLFKNIFKFSLNFIKYLIKKITITEFKESVFSFLKDIKDIDQLVSEFWVIHEKNIKKFYLEQKTDKDIIISASPEFLLKPIAKKLKVNDLIASDVDKYTGKFKRPNSRGNEKVKLLYQKYPKAIVEVMYSDSMHDKPLLDIAKKSYVVIGNKIIDYQDYQPNIFKRIINYSLKIYHKNKEIWNYLIVGGCTTIVSIGSYGIFSKILAINYIVSNILSWILAVLFAYITNRLFVFYSKENNKIKESLIFIGSRLLTLGLETFLLIILVDLILIDDLISKIFTQIVVVISNYLISKLIVFKK